MSGGKKHIAVLKGGWSAEREVSLVSGAQCAAALRRFGFAVTEIDAAPDLAARLSAIAPDIVFNALHGRWGEDGCVQGMLEIMGLPYTHSGVKASAIAMDKQVAKSLFAADGIKCPEGQLIPYKDLILKEPPYFPCVVKPVTEGSSVGVAIIHEGQNDFPAGLSGESWQFGEMALVERFIPGREVTVAVMDGQALAVTEIEPKTRFYDYEAKYANGGSQHILPADLPDDIAENARAIAEQAHRVLGCRGVTRADFRYDPAEGAEGLYLLEINTQPGMTPTSLVPEQAEFRGIGFDQLCQWLVEDASCAR